MAVVGTGNKGKSLTSRDVDNNIILREVINLSTLIPERRKAYFRQRGHQENAKTRKRHMLTQEYHILILRNYGLFFYLIVL